VKVDKELRRKGFNYLRYIDDYTCYVKSYEEAERFFIELSYELNKFELSLNLKKSSIEALPKASVKDWVNRLSHYTFPNAYIKNDKEGIRVKELQGFFDFAINLMLKENGDASVLNYAIKIISKKHLGTKAKIYYFKLIHHLVLLYPYLITVLEEYVFKPYKADVSTIKGIASDLYDYGIEKKIFEPCSYVLYWAVKYDFKIDDDKIKNQSIKSNDCIFMLSAYVYHNKVKRRAYLKEYKQKANKLKSNDYDRYWLFIYEVLPWPDLPVPFKQMKKSKVSFLKKKYQ
jgi:hypothetical protein